jgi:hypothetical protein
MKYYINNYISQDKLEKTINISYAEKYKLSDIAKLITKNLVPIEILNDELKNNYSGDNLKLQKLNLPLFGLSKSLKLYENIFASK